MNQSTDTLYTQPSLGSTVDFGNPIAQGLWACYLFNERGGMEVLDHGNMGAGVLSFNNTIPTFPPTDPEWTQYGLRIGNGRGYVNNNKTVKSTFNPVRASHTIRVVHIPKSWPNAFTALIDCTGTAGSGRILNIFVNTSGNISYRGIGGADGTPSANTVGMELNKVNDLVWVRAYGDGTAGATHTHYWYLNGKLAHTENGLSSVAWPTDGYNFVVGGNPSGGGDYYDGEILQVQCWDRALQLAEVEALASNPYALISDGPFYFPALKPATSATATATFGTITLTAPTATAFAVTDATATATFGTITLTAPTAQAVQSNTATATFGTITLAAPTASGVSVDSTATASFATIYLSPPTAFPYGPQFSIALQEEFYWGRFSRGQNMNVSWNPSEAPDDIATVDFWLEATTIAKTISLPMVDEEKNVFGFSLLIDNAFTDGNYVAVIRFSFNGNSQATIAYFSVQGGDGAPPIISILELNRTLGRAVVTQDGSGSMLIGYSPILKAYEVD